MLPKAFLILLILFPLLVLPIALDEEEYDFELDKSKSCNRMAGGVNETSGDWAPPEMKEKEECVCNFTVPHEAHIPFPAGGFFLLFKEFELKEDDKMDIVDHQGNNLFSNVTFSGYKDMFSILTGAKNLSVNIMTSVTKGPRRIKMYFTNDPSKGGSPISITSGSLTSPFYRPANKTVSVLYKLAPQVPDTKLAYSFSHFNLSQNSRLSLKVGSSEEKSFNGDKLPDDFLMYVAGDFNLTLDLSVPKQQFVLEYETVASACSNEFNNLKVSQKLVSPKKSELTLSSVNGITCRWLLTADDSKASVGIDLQSLKLSSPMDYFDVRDGGRRDSPVLTYVTAANLYESTSTYLRSSSKKLVVTYFTYLRDSNATFSLDANSYAYGGYFKGSGLQNVKDPNQAEAVYLFEEADNEQALIESSQCVLTKGTLDIYDNFKRNSTPMLSLKPKDKFFSIVSPGKQLMLIPKDFDKDSCSVSYKGIVQGSHYISKEPAGTLNYAGNCNQTGSWTILPQKTAKDDVLILQISYLSLRSSDIVKVLSLLPEQASIAVFNSSSRCLPPIYVDPFLGVYFEVIRGTCTEEEESLPVIKASYSIQPSCDKEIKLVAGQKIQVTSPSYPNSYPLRAQCKTKLTYSSSVLLSLNTLKLAPGHKLEVLAFNDTVLASYDSNTTSLPDDILLSSGVSLSFDSSSSSLDQSLCTPQGFSANVFAIDYGAIVTDTKGSLEVPGYPAVTKDNVKACYWQVKVPPSSSEGTVNIIRFNVTVGKDGSSDYNFRIFEGLSIRDAALTNFTSPDVLSRTNVISVLYEVVGSDTKPRKSLQIEYDVFDCSDLCENGICMHEDWKCNNVDNCGDFSDERNCTGLCPAPTKPPVTPAPPQERNGVSPVAVGIVVPLMFILGIIATLLFPLVVRKIRSGQYREFRDMPEVA